MYCLPSKFAIVKFIFDSFSKKSSDNVLQKLFSLCMTILTIHNWLRACRPQLLPKLMYLGQQISNLLGQLAATSIADLYTKLVQGD